MVCVHFHHMSNTVTIRVSKELAAWLEDTAAKTGVSQGKILRDQLEMAMAERNLGSPRSRVSAMGTDGP